MSPPACGVNSGHQDCPAGTPVLITWPLAVNNTCSMKYYLSFLGLFLLCTTVNSQIVKGFVMDQNTKSKISYASVYISGTYFGTNTDSNGYFQLTIPKNYSMPLTISALGYYSVTLSDYLPDTINIIFLNPKLYELKEVFITAKGDPSKRNTYLLLFKKEFLGTTVSGRNCKIINENDITLSYNSNTRTFIAFSPNPIIIDNEYLGYKIEYYLDRFEFHYPKNYGQIQGLIVGNFKFLEYNYTNSNQQKRFEKRRETSYRGSRMHFFREVWNNNLESTGFEIKDSLNTKVDLKKIVVRTDSAEDSDVSKYLRYNGILCISYYSKKISSKITMIKDSAYFDKNGFFDPHAIIWEGEMAEQRIGDLLPYEYQIKK
jgi:hypothetical protein